MSTELLRPQPTLPDNLAELAAQMYAMTDDPLAHAGTNIVIYRGNPAAKLMIVGEAPGPEENKQGKPFVGKSGQLLDQILAAVQFDTNQDVFISNSVFRMPPGENGQNFRKPTRAEIEFYRPYVWQIINIINPHIILLTGNVAIQSILGDPDPRITKLRGQWTEKDGRWFMPIFHPSYLLRNPSRTPGSPKSLMWEDVQEVRRKYDELMG
jgi:uracil-DNA glycosylase